MCLILFAKDLHPDYQIILAANRDEFLERPTRQAGPWEELPGLIAGKDLRSGGTWLGVSIDGRLSAVTNFREPGIFQQGASSRGLLVTDYLNSDSTPKAYMEMVSEKSSDYNGFNLISFHNGEMAYLSNRIQATPRTVESGMYGLSNHVLDTPWPKVAAGKEVLRALIAADQIEPAVLLDMLVNRDQAADDRLPDTGVGIEKERELSAAFIQMKGYGTRCSTVILIDRKGIISFTERSFDETGSITGTVEYELHP